MTYFDNCADTHLLNQRKTEEKNVDIVRLWRSALHSCWCRVYVLWYAEHHYRGVQKCTLLVRVTSVHK